MNNVRQVLREYSDRRFSWGGQADCCVFACAVVEAIHGHNPMEGKFDYTNKAEALNAISEHGNLVDICIAHLGQPLPVEGAKDGDILAALQEDGTWIVGVAIGERMAVKTKISLMDWPLHYAQHRWSM